jgi:hypothetical protein
VLLQAFYLIDTFPLIIRLPEENMAVDRTHTFASQGSIHVQFLYLKYYIHLGMRQIGLCPMILRSIEIRQLARISEGEN